MNRIQETPPGKQPLDYLMWLRDIRNARLAEQTGIPDQSISRYRRGLLPKPEHRKLIAEALGQEQDALWPGVEVAVDA